MKKYILSRPVNALKKIYAPSYLGAKIRAAKSTPSLDSITEIATKKRLNSSEAWNYKIFKVFKGIGDAGEPEYRDYMAPSPSTATAEAYILNELSESLKNITYGNVYSYIRAEKNSAHNYEYYLWNYERRNQDILNALSEDKDSVALFFDIKNFYGSVDTALLITMLKRHSVLGDSANAYALDFLIDQLHQSPRGIPIGTELSHLAADIFLSALDASLLERFGARYFRYVDDITIVCKSEELAVAEKHIHDLVSDIGLSSNEKKREVFSHAQWQKEMNTAPVKGENFHEYCESLGAWIGGDGSKHIWLERELKNLGFQIPLEKIVARNRSQQISYQWNEHEIISRSKEIRSKYLNAVDSITESRPNDPSRWFLQKTKRAINPLFYLLNKEEYGIIQSATAASKSLTTQQEVSNAIHSGNCKTLISFPGVTVNTFCEIWKTIEPDGMQLREPLPKIKTDAQLESILVLAMHNIVEPPPEILPTSLWLALRPGVTSRSSSLTGFEKEIQSLRIGLKPKSQSELLRGRIDSSEDIGLEGLELGSQSISP